MPQTIKAPRGHTLPPYYSPFIALQKIHQFTNIPELMKTYTTTPTAQPITAGEALTAFISAVEFLGLFFVACIAHAFRLACRLANACAEWLRSSHNFTPGETEDSEKVILTGWQYLGVIFFLFLFVILASCAG